MPKTTTGFIPSFDQERLYVKTFQNSDKPEHTIVFVHGLGGESEAYGLLLPELLEKIPNCLLILYDQRGHGWSTHRYPAEINSLFEIASRDLQAVCQHFKLTKPIFVGHSLGGIVIQEYTCRQLSPAAHQLFLIAAPASLPRLSVLPEFWFQCLKRYGRFYKHKPTRRTIADHVKYKGSWDYSPFRVASDMKHTGILNYILLWSSVVGWQNNNIECLNLPETYYLYSEKDWIIPRQKLERVMEKMPQIKKVLIPTNHNSVINLPEPIIETIVKAVVH